MTEESDLVENSDEEMDSECSKDTDPPEDATDTSVLKIIPVEKHSGQIKSVSDLGKDYFVDLTPDSDVDKIIE